MAYLFGVLKVSALCDRVVLVTVFAIPLYEEWVACPKGYGL